jgi:hypothetical protein
MADTDQVIVKTVSMYSIHWATVEAFAKDQGYGSVSAALRRIIDEWSSFKQGQLYTHTNHYDPPAPDNP